MNDQLTTFAREQILDGLKKCTDEQQMLFKRMYSHTNPELPLADIVNALDETKLDWAMSQVSSTIKKNKRNNNEK
jgi:hypothetical protein